MVERIRPGEDPLPGTARPAGTSRGAPSTSDLLNAPFLGGTFGLGRRVMPPAGLPVAIALRNASCCTPGVLSFLIGPSQPDRGGLLREAFPLLANGLTSGLLSGARSRVPALLVALTGSGVDTGRSASGVLFGYFLEWQTPNTYTDTCWCGCTTTGTSIPCCRLSGVCSLPV